MQPFLYLMQLLSLWQLSWCQSFAEPQVCDTHAITSSRIFIDCFKGCECVINFDFFLQKLPIALSLVYQIFPVHPRYPYLPEIHCIFICVVQLRLWLLKFKFLNLKNLASLLFLILQTNFYIKFGKCYTNFGTNLATTTQVKSFTELNKCKYIII